MGRMSLLLAAAILAFGIAVAVFAIRNWWRRRPRCPYVGRTETTRWIEVNEKKNKPPEILLEVQRFCAGCGAIMSKSWFTEEQCRRQGITVPKPS